jgi:hypothetical protein
MTVTFVSDARNTLDKCDSITGWTGTDGPVLFTSSPTPIEASGCLGLQASAAVEDAYTAITSDDYSAGGTLSIWMQDRAEFDTVANTGIGIVVGDGTNRIAYSVGGSDGTAFRHDTGPVKWACFLLDLANKPANFVAIAGSEASLNEAAITQVGVRFDTTVKSVGGADNCFWDVIRFADIGDALVFRGGTTGGAAGNMSEIAVLDRGTATTQAYGVVRELAAGVYGIQGNLVVGDSGSSANQYFEEANVTYAWEDRGLSADNYYRFALIGSSTATTCSLIFDASTFAVPAAASASFDADGADIDVCDFTGCTFIGFDQGITTSSLTSANWTNCTFIGNDQIVASGCDLTGSSISGFEGTADTGALIYNLAADPDGELDGITFTKGTAATHAIQYGTSAAQTQTLRDIVFTGYTNTIGSSSAPLSFPDTGGDVTWTINVVGGSGLTADGYQKARAGDTVIIVLNPVTVQVTSQEADGTAVGSVNTFLQVTSTLSGYPYLGACTLDRNGSVTVTVTHGSHGLVTGDKVRIISAGQDADVVGVFTITVTTADAYTYASGQTTKLTAVAATSTFVLLYGLTHATTGVLSMSKVFVDGQGVSGNARKGSTNPFWKHSQLVGTIAVPGGLLMTALMLPDL